MNTKKEEILKKIKINEVKMKPKWWFGAEKVGMRGVYWGLVVLMVWCLIAILNWNELSELGYEIIAEDFPIWGIIGVAFGLMLAVAVVVRIGDNYKKNPWVWVIMTITSVVLATLLLNFLF